MSLEKELENVKFLQVHQSQKEELKVKTKKNLVISESGGIFNIDTNLISVVGQLLNLGYEEVVLPDKNFNPIKIKDLNEFYENILNQFVETMNEFHLEYENLKKSRKVSKVMDFDNE